MDYDTLKEQLLEFSNDRDWEQFHTPENLAKSISIESGELLECYQWSDSPNKEDVEDELADIFIYCIFMAEKLNVSLTDIASKKMAKNAEKYPVSKAKGNATKYTKL